MCDSKERLQLFWYTAGSQGAIAPTPGVQGDGWALSPEPSSEVSAGLARKRQAGTQAAECAPELSESNMLPDGTECPLLWTSCFVLCVSTPPLCRT